MTTWLEVVARCDEASGALLADSRVINRILVTAGHFGCQHLAGAGSAGERLVGAAVHASGGKLTSWRAGRDGPVLVVDGVIVSTIGLEQAMARVRSVTREPVFGLAFRDKNLPVATAEKAITVLPAPVGLHACDGLTRLSS